VWLLSFLRKCYLINCIEANLLVVLTFPDIAMATNNSSRSSKPNNPTKQKTFRQANHTEMLKYRKLDNSAA
jgi:hypothetical protein